jgi:rhodanese-related sulfurtransferase
MRRAGVVVFAAVVALALAAMCAGLVTAAEVLRMTVEELKAKLGNADVMVLDVRAEVDWKESNTKILGAVRESPREVSSWARKYPKDKILVFYCA